MIVGAALIEVHVHGSRSLKQKRGVVQSIKQRVRNRFNLSVSEVGGQDTWQRAVIGLSAAGSEASRVRSVLERAIEFISVRERVDGQWHDYPTSLLVAWVHQLQGENDLARVEAERARIVLEADIKARPDEAKLHSALGLAYALLGRGEKAVRAGQRSVELMPLERDVFVGAWILQDMAWIYLLSGEPDRAVEAFDQLLRVPSVWTAEVLLLDPRAKPLRDHSGFLELVELHRNS